MLSLKGKITREYPPSFVNQFDEFLVDVVEMSTNFEEYCVLLEFIKMLSMV